MTPNNITNNSSVANRVAEELQEVVAIEDSVQRAQLSLNEISTPGSPIDQIPLTASPLESDIISKAARFAVRYAKFFGGVDWGVDDAIGAINAIFHGEISSNHPNHIFSFASNILSSVATGLMIVIPSYIVNCGDLDEEYRNYQTSNEVDKLKIVAATLGVVASTAMLANPVLAAGGYATASSVAGVSGNAIALVQNVIKLAEVYRDRSNDSSLAEEDKSFFAIMSHMADFSKATGAATCGQLLSGIANGWNIASDKPNSCMLPLFATAGLVLICGSAISGAVDRCNESEESPAPSTLPVRGASGLSRPPIIQQIS